MKEKSRLAIGIFICRYISTDIGTWKKKEQQQLFDEDGQSICRHDLSSFIYDRPLLKCSMSFWECVWSLTVANTEVR